MLFTRRHTTVFSGSTSQEAVDICLRSPSCETVNLVSITMAAPNPQDGILHPSSVERTVSNETSMQDNSSAPFTTSLFPSTAAPPIQADGSVAAGGFADMTLFPASYHNEDAGRVYPLDNGNLSSYLGTELSVERLDRIHHTLWLTGLPRPPRPLHRQLMLNREIKITESMDMHLVWGEGDIFIKPLPRFLLDPTFWKSQLACREECDCKTASVTTQAAQQNGSSTECAQKKQRRTALGFLLTYTALIPHESDFAIAIEKHLLPRSCGDDKLPHWQDWRNLVKEVLKPDVYDHIDRRFIYGELRLSRLNWIQRFSKIWVFRPYHTVWQNYAAFFRDQLAWVATATVYIAVVLTAMQVALATDNIGKDEAFQWASYVFSIFSILGPVGAAFLILVAFVFKGILNWIYTIASHRKARNKHTSGDPS
jgi:hypothetical protein